MVTKKCLGLLLYFLNLFLLQTPTYNWENSTKEGPWGGEGGTEWNYMPNGAITEITIRHGSFIDSLSFKSIDGNGTVQNSMKIGGDGGGTTQISIDWPREYLISVNGTYDTHEKSSGIKSISFNTNRRTYGPFGQTNGTPFDFSVKDGIITGFYGRASTLIDAIGIHVKKYEDLLKPTYQVQIDTPEVDDEKKMNMDLDLPRKMGLWGGNDGKLWDDGRFDTIKQEIVRAITLQYQSKDGNSIVSKKYDGGGDDATYNYNI